MDIRIIKRKEVMKMARKWDAEKALLQVCRKKKDKTFLLWLAEWVDKVYPEFETTKDVENPADRLDRIANSLKP